LLLFNELLLFLVFPQLVHCVLLLSINFNLAHLLDLLDLLPLHMVNQLLIGTSKVFSLHHLLSLSLHLSAMFLLHLILDLSLDELSLELVILHPLDESHLILMQLVINCLLVSCLFLIFNQELFPDLNVVFVHFLFLEFIPLLLDLLFYDGPSLLKALLGFSLLNGVAKLKFGVEGFDLVCGFMHVLVGSPNGLDSSLDLQFEFNCIHLSSFYLFLFKSSDPFVIFLLSHCVNCVGPVRDSSFG
jgi:hypothetical protein